MVLAEKESLLVSVIYSEIENRIVVKVRDAAQVKGVHAGKLVKELAKAMGGSGGDQQHFAQGGGEDAVKFKAAGPAIWKELESQIH
jgi:alanyl-tRNA synthetase